METKDRPFSQPHLIKGNNYWLYKSFGNNFIVLFPQVVFQYQIETNLYKLLSVKTLTWIPTSFLGEILADIDTMKLLPSDFYIMQTMWSANHCHLQCHVILMNIHQVHHQDVA